MTNSNVQVQIKKPQTKAQMCWSFYRTLMTKDLLTSNTEDSKAKIREINKQCKTHFMSSEVGLTDKGANTYIQICKDRMLDKDPHAGRKLANKNSRLAKKSTVDQTAEVVAEEPIDPKFDLSKRWVVGYDKNMYFKSFDTRAEAKKYAKDNDLKWFDSKTF